VREDVSSDDEDDELACWKRGKSEVNWISRGWRSRYQRRGDARIQTSDLWFSKMSKLVVE